MSSDNQDYQVMNQRRINLAGNAGSKRPEATESDDFILWLQGFMDAIPNVDSFMDTHFNQVEDRVREEYDRITHKHSR